MKLSQSSCCVERDSKPTPPLSTQSLYESSRVLLASVSSSVLFLNHSGHVGFANPAAELMFGCSTDALAGLEFAQLFEPAESEVSPSNQTSRQQSRPDSRNAISRRGTLLCKNGVRLPVRVNLSVVTNGVGEVLAIVATVEDLSDYMQMNEYVQLMANFDTPTGLPKMEAILRRVEASVVRLHATGKTFAFLQIQVDHLHRIHESLGHEAVVFALREIGQRLGTKTAESDLLTRYTGDGFAILLHDCTSEEDAARRGSALLEVFDEPFKIEHYCVRITASVGISFGANTKTTQSSMLAEAEFAVRRSKSLGGNRVASFLPEMMDWHAHSVQMESQMQVALEQEQFFVVYQPQVCFKTGKLIGVEALLRWNNPGEGLVMPGTFIPIAEESGMIVQLGAWCLQTACREVVQLQKRLGHRVRLAVNVSPKQVHATGFREMVQASLDASGLPPECLEIEITEGLLMSHDNAALQVITQLQDRGVTAAIDDFGMGFSNLAYITRFKFNRLKIDRSFVGGCTSDRSSQMIIESVIFLARSLGIEIVAEGIETQEQAVMLAALGCDLAQGYFYAKPMAIDNVYEFSKKVEASEAVHDLQPDSPACAPDLMLLNTAITDDTGVAGLSPMGQPPLSSRSKEVADSTKPKPGSDSTLSKASQHSGSYFDFLNPREPLCRPSKPMRLAGAAKMIIRTAEELPHFLPTV